MSSLFIGCPNTGRPVSTGIEIEPHVLRQLPNLCARMLCPACGQEHVWMTRAAWLADEAGPVPARPPAIEAA
jgi:hypothetical protein